MPDKHRTEGFKTSPFQRLEPELSRHQAVFLPVSFLIQLTKTPQTRDPTWDISGAGGIH